MPCRALSVPKNSGISRLVVCDASRVLAWISSTKDESSSSGILSISKYVGNSLLSLVVALKDLSSGGGVLSTPKKLLIVFTPLNILGPLVGKTHLFVLLKEPIYYHCKTRKL